MAKLTVNQSFPFQGVVRRTDTILELGDSILKKELEKGYHPEKKDRFISPLLNHCSPADAHTAKLMKVDFEEDVIDTEDGDEIPGLQAEFDAIGKAYDKRWGVKKLKDELIKAKKATGN